MFVKNVVVVAVRKTEWFTSSADHFLGNFACVIEQ